MKAVTSAARLVLCGSLLACPACSTVPSDPYVPAGERGVTTVGIDDHDYQLAAQNLTQKMLKRGLPRGYVVALGPVDTKRLQDPAFDIELLQNKIAAILDENGTLRFAVLTKPMTDGVVPYDEMLKLIELNWYNKNPIDAEDLQKFGKMAKINGLLFGRVSSLQRRLPGGGREVTYTFVWRLANMETGVDDMTLEHEIRKNVR